MHIECKFCACSEWSPGLQYFNISYIFSIFSSSPPDGPSSGTESNLPVSHPAPGIQIVDFATPGTQMVD